MLKDTYVVTKDWITAAGFRAVIVLVVRDTPSHYCGYVAVPNGHPAFNNPNNEGNLSVHGGVTYEGGDDDYPVETAKGTFWWIGYDCAHAGDKTSHDLGGVFRDLDYNIHQCENLARQLSPVAPSTQAGIEYITATPAAIERAEKLLTNLGEQKQDDGTWISPNGYLSKIRPIMIAPIAVIESWTNTPATAET